MGEQLSEGLARSKSEAEFEEIGREEVKGEGKAAGGGGSWTRGWGARALAAMGREDDVSKASGVDTGI